MRTENDNKKLAQLLYPNVTQTFEDLMQKYAPRNLVEGAEVTRLAPSPTGFLHTGQLYSAMISYLTAKNTNGVFYMRLEDTDSKREIENAGTIAYDMLCAFGMQPQEGYTGDNNPEVGDYGPYVQSNRKDLYAVFAKALVEKGRAFPCFCKKSESKEDILKRREEELETSSDIDGHDACRDLSLEEIENNIKQNKPWALRLYSMGDPEKSFKFKDQIKGEREIRENAKDIVLVKSDGIPPYALAHLVDDTLMHTTTIVRGEEWYPSLSAHLELFRAMGVKPPKYAHTPVICKEDNGNKRKLSKRKDPEADTRQYLKWGYPIVAVKEYLLNLLNSDFENWRLQNPDKYFEEYPFSIKKIGSNNPMFDFDKLSDVSKNVVSRMTAKEVFESTLDWAKREDLEFAKILEQNAGYAIKVLNIDREKPRPRKDIAKWSDVPELYFYMFEDMFWSRMRGYDYPEHLNKEDIKAVLLDYATNFKMEANNSEWFNSIKQVADRCGFASDMKAYKLNPENFKGNVADVSTIIRVAITTKTQSPDLFEIINLLGEEEVKKRLISAIKQ